jgi:succinate dehydrogenase / fumarate reductase, iron-sulfur subunit
MDLVLHVWRQKNEKDAGKFVRYELSGVSADMSFLEMLDTLNEDLIKKGEEPVAFEHDCREGICGSCAMVINGRPHGPQRLTTACQLHMRSFTDREEIWIEPWRAKAFPIVKDLVANRAALDRIVQAGGYISVNTGAAVDANAVPVPKDAADRAMDAAACIGCGACVAVCPNGSAMLYTGAKVAHLANLPQGQPERYRRVVAMVEQMDKEMFGSCTNYGECQDACPKGISINVIGQTYKDYIRANFVEVKKKPAAMKPQ